jgi:hypothetical protein
LYSLSACKLERKSTSQKLDISYKLTLSDRPSLSSAPSSVTMVRPSSVLWPHGHHFT